MRKNSFRSQEIGIRKIIDRKPSGYDLKPWPKPTSASCQSLRAKQNRNRLYRDQTVTLPKLNLPPVDDE